MGYDFRQCRQRYLWHAGGIRTWIRPLLSETNEVLMPWLLMTSHCVRLPQRWLALTKLSEVLTGKLYGAIFLAYKTAIPTTWIWNQEYCQHRMWSNNGWEKLSCAGYFITAAALPWTAHYVLITQLQCRVRNWNTSIKQGSRCSPGSAFSGAVALATTFPSCVCGCSLRPGRLATATSGRCWCTTLHSGECW